MRKTVLLTGLAALAALSSCTMDEIKEVNQGTPIGFRTSVATRGMEAEQSTLINFYCTAWVNSEDENPYFEDLEFSYSGESYITTGSVYYWPKGKNLNFYAYAPGVGEMGEGAAVNITKTAQTITGYQVPQNIDEQDDLIYATNVNVAETPFVDIGFGHMLSKIEVNARTSSDLYKYEFAGVRIGGVSMKGDVDLGTKTWSNRSNIATCERTDEENPVELDPAKSTYAYDLLGELRNNFEWERSNYAFMIPQEFTAWDPSAKTDGAYISVLVKISTAAGIQVYPETEGEYAWVAVPIPAGEWLPGYSYNYTLDFTDGAGYVDPTDPDDPGKSVLGEAIKITMTLNDMADADLGVVKNQDMIGVWKATYFKYEHTDYSYNNETGEYVMSYLRTDVIDEGKFTQVYTYYDYNPETQEYTVNRTELREEEELLGDAFFNRINSRAGNFGYVKIVDGTELLTLNPTNGSFISSPYEVVREDYDGDGNTDLVMYIETYKDPNNSGSYLNIPIIKDFIPAPGTATVKTYHEGSSWKEEVTIYYTVSPLEETEEPAEPTEPTV